MANVKVLVIALLLKGNKQAVYGDVVDGDSLTDTVEKLVVEGYVEVTEEEIGLRAEVEARGAVKAPAAPAPVAAVVAPKRNDLLAEYKTLFGVAAPNTFKVPDLLTAIAAKKLELATPPAPVVAPVITPEPIAPVVEGAPALDPASIIPPAQ